MYLFYFLKIYVFQQRITCRIKTIIKSRLFVHNLIIYLLFPLKLTYFIFLWYKILSKPSFKEISFHSVLKSTESKIWANSTTCFPLCSISFQPWCIKQTQGSPCMKLLEEEEQFKALGSWFIIYDNTSAKSWTCPWTWGNGSWPKHHS